MLQDLQDSILFILQILLILSTTFHRCHDLK